MKRVTTGFCVAAAFGCIATLGAQTPTPPAPAAPRAPMTDKARDVTITGCLSKGADGKFVLQNARVDSPTAGTSGTTATTPPPATPGTPATTTGGTPATTTGTAGANAAAMSWALSGGTDLDKLVGQKVQVTGRTGWDGPMDHAKGPDSPAAAGTAAGTVGTSGTTSTAATEDQRKDARADQPKLDVQSVKMIAPSCS